MNAAAFAYPSLIWILPVAIAGGLLVWLVFRNVIAASVVGVVLLPLAWLTHGWLLPVRMESWLEGQRAYAILFRDFPQDKQHFISEYVDAYEKEGDLGVARKQEEMKIVMLEHHVRHYISNTPLDVLKKYIVAETWFLSAINARDPKACDNFLADPSSFVEAWRAVGSDTFLTPVRYYPLMITSAVDSPEPPSPADKAQAVQAYDSVVKKLQASGVKAGAAGAPVNCDTWYREFYALSQLPPKDGALALKYMLGEDHLQGTNSPAATGVLRMLLPF